MLAAAFERFGASGSEPGDWLRLLGAALGAGVAVKLMDDHLDQDADRLGPRGAPWNGLGPGAVPYALVSLLLGAMLRPDAAAGLFLAAYAAGMAHDWQRMLPTGLPGWGESALALALSWAAAGGITAAAALALIVFVQCIDDIVDVELDGQTGSRNLVTDLGSTETTLLAGGALLFAVSLSPQLSVAVFVAMAFIDTLFARLSGQGGGPGPQAVRDGRPGP